MHKGISTGSAESQLEEMNGVESASVGYDSIEQSTSNDAVMEVRVVLKDGTSVPDPARLAEYVARVAWSSGDKDPTGGMAVSIVSSPQQEFGAALEAQGWGGVVYDTTDRDSFNIGYNRLVGKFGKWPAESPQVQRSIP